MVLRNGIEIMEKDDQKYALIPIKAKEEADKTTSTIQGVTSKKSSKKKKNKIKCSFFTRLATQGHTAVRD